MLILTLIIVVLNGRAKSDIINIYRNCDCLSNGTPELRDTFIRNIDFYNITLYEYLNIV